MTNANPSDTELLDDWLCHRRELAFHALVQRYQALVHAAALRRCGDESISAEATQLTFISLAQKAKSLRSRTTLIGWLHLTSVFHTRNLVRRQQREIRKRQLLRTHMDTQLPAPATDAWLQIQPVVDESLSALSAQDRETLLLRFYRSLSVREIADLQGVAIDAAQKRLTRAIDRMRHQLTRRGCAVGSSLSAVLLVGFTPEAQAGLHSASAIATKAIAAASATTTLSTIQLITITMTKKTTVVAALLLVGAITVAIVKNQPKETTPAVAAGSTSSTKPVANSSSDGSTISTRSKHRDPAENPELISKYGDSRTKLSKQVAGNVISLLEDAIGMGEMASNGDLAKSLYGNESVNMMVINELCEGPSFTDAQKKQATALYEDFQKRDQEKARASVESLKNNPTALMQTLLAGDAFSRGKITEAEYKEIQTATAKDLKGVINPLNNNNAFGGNPLLDETFNRGFEAILDPTQAKDYQAQVAELQAESAQKDNPRDIWNLPTMALEKLDETVVSTKKMSSGMKLMFEGASGLEGLEPGTDQQLPAGE